MKAVVATNRDKELLEKIKDALINKWVSSKVNPQEMSKRFDEKVSSQADQYLFGALLNEKDQVIVVASLYLEYKLTRGLSQIYHLEMDYKNCSQAEELFFQSEIVQMIPGYKITGLHVTQSKTFPPHQVYMEIDLQKSSKVIGSL